MTKADARALLVGRRVLATYTKGLAKWNAAKQAEAKLLVNDLLILVDVDKRKGGNPRTRATRLAYELGVSSAHVRKILRTTRLHPVGAFGNGIRYG
jgi:hypothetical protein